MKSLQLSLTDPFTQRWIIFEKEDNLPYFLPPKTDFIIASFLCAVDDQRPSRGEDHKFIANIKCVVDDHRYREEDSKFITNIKIEDEYNVYPKMCESFKEALLKNGWKIVV